MAADTPAAAGIRSAVIRAASFIAIQPPDVSFIFARGLAFLSLIATLPPQLPLRHMPLSPSPDAAITIAPPPSPSCHFSVTIVVFFVTLPAGVAATAPFSPFRFSPLATLVSLRRCRFSLFLPGHHATPLIISRDCAAIQALPLRFIFWRHADYCCRFFHFFAQLIFTMMLFTLMPALYLRVFLRLFLSATPPLAAIAPAFRLLSAAHMSHISR